MTNEPLILAMETATRAGSVSLVLGNRVLASVAGNASLSHSSDLIENIESVLSDGGRELGAVDVFAAAQGPGSFTGIRIGLATAKALAMSMGRKCVGVSTLAAVAAAAGKSSRTVALLPAGRGEVFAQMFEVEDGNVNALDSATHIAPQVLAARYESFRTLRWAGEGAHLQTDILREAANRQGINFQLDSALPATHVDAWTVAPRQDNLANAVAKLALPEWKAGRLIRPQDLHAVYLRASDAEIKNNA